jgi:hypothetical protein
MSMRRSFSRRQHTPSTAEKMVDLLFICFLLYFLRLGCPVVV